MKQLIDKSTLVAEIEKYISNYKGILNKVDKSSDDWVTSTLMLESKIDILQHILFFINTLEVKEVDLKVEIERLIKSYSPIHTSEGKYKVEAYKEVLDIINSNSLQSHCSDCTNDKGCINCEGGNMHEVKKKEPEGALKELLDNIDPVEYDKVRREMKKELQVLEGIQSKMAEELFKMNSLDKRICPLENK